MAHRPRNHALPHHLEDGYEPADTTVAVGEGVERLELVVRHRNAMR